MYAILSDGTNARGAAAWNAKITDFGLVKMLQKPKAPAGGEGGNVRAPSAHAHAAVTLLRPSSSSSVGVSALQRAMLPPSSLPASPPQSSRGKGARTSGGNPGQASISEVEPLVPPEANGAADSADGEPAAPPEEPAAGSGADAPSEAPAQAPGRAPEKQGSGDLDDAGASFQEVYVLTGGTGRAPALHLSSPAPSSAPPRRRLLSQPSCLLRPLLRLLCRHNEHNAVPTSIWPPRCSSTRRPTRRWTATASRSSCGSSSAGGRCCSTGCGWTSARGSGWSTPRSGGR